MEIMNVIAYKRKVFENFYKHSYLILLLSCLSQNQGTCLHTAKKVLGPTKYFPIQGSGKRTENLHRIWLWRPVWFDYRTYIGLGKQILGGHRQNLVYTRTQKIGAVTPQETDPYYLWVSRSLQQRCGSVVAWCMVGVLSAKQYAWDLVKDVAIIFIACTIVWSHVKQLGRNTFLPINRKSD